MTADVCIIGGGMVGCLMAAELCKRGYRVTILEAGVWPTPPNFPHDTRDVYTNSGEIEYPLNNTRVKGVGGTTHHWGGYTPRLLEFDFRTKTSYGTGEDWPIAYNDLEPYYAQAEKALGVAGNADNEFAALRSGPFPMRTPPVPTALKDKFAKIGLSICSQPRAVTAKAWDGRPPDSHYRAHEVHLPKAMATGRLRLITDATVVRLETDNSGNVKQAVYAGLQDRNEKILQAERYIVACGGVESPRLLLLSASGQFPDGLANSSGLVGVYFMEHPRFDLNLYFDTPFFLPFNRVLSFQHYDRHKDEDRGAMLLTIGGFPRPKDFIRQYYWGENLRDKILTEVNRRIYIGCTIEDTPNDSNYVALASEQKDFFGNPAPRINYSFHPQTEKSIQKGRTLLKSIGEDLDPVSMSEGGTGFLSHHMGTCRMSRDPSKGVVTSNLVTHDVPNLMVVGSANFVTGGAVNPTLTIAALSLRAVDFLSDS